jgi:hypothetical protein
MMAAEAAILRACVEALPGQGEPRVVGELLEEGPLSSAVALAERVDGVDLTEVIGQRSSGIHACR